MIQKKSITGEPTVFVAVHGLKLEIRISGEMIQASPLATPGDAQA